MSTTLPALIQLPNAAARIALCAPGRPALTYTELSQQIEALAKTWHTLGLRRTSVIALVLPDGPELAVAFLGTTAACAAAPLNPGYRQEEFEFYYTDLQAEAVLLPASYTGPARQAALHCNLRVLEMRVDPQAPAGVFSLHDIPTAEVSAPVTGAASNDIALLLHTSGTTSRPKLVPLTHANLSGSAQSIAASLRLTPTDRCLNVMPLFHIHGLAGCLLASLAAGSSVCCPPGFDAARFFDWLAECKPTWYSAVPSMHQAVLARAPHHRAEIDATPLRLVRSSSAALPQAVKERLAEVFHAPVVEAYGMTEASHQIAVNPLETDRQKVGSVGLPYGAAVAILSESGTVLPGFGQSGEIGIRGSGVTAGYLRNPAANQAAFTQDGWFRTGDQGILDADGMLYITGRLKEIINRGGEKVMPGEVDEVLLGHPGVEQAVTFAIPDRTLGEEIAAAVVRRDPALTEVALRQYVRSRLADHKVPRKIVFMEQIPRGPTGKTQRIGLAERLGLVGIDAPAPSIRTRPSTDLETLIAAVWQDVLEIPAPGPAQDFLEIGGDSISAGRIASRLSQEFDVPFSIVDFFEASTIEKQALWIELRLVEQIEAMSDEDASQELNRLRQEDANE